MVPALLRSGASIGVQPMIGSRKASSSRLSLPLLIFCPPATAASLAALSWAVWPLPLSRYVEVTLSLWSWSIISNDRVVRHGLPVAADVPAAGTVSLPAASARFTAWKKPVPLQKATWPKIEPFSPLTQRPWVSAPRLAPTRVRLVPLNPKSTVTTAPAGSVGTTGLTAGWVPCVMTSGS